MKKLRTFLILFAGSALLSFGIYNIHSRSLICEGGELGIELLLLHWFRISPAITALAVDGIAYFLGMKRFGRGFLFKAITATMLYSFCYHIYERFPPLLPDLSAKPLIAALLGALFVGIGVGLVVKEGGACGGDDAIARLLSVKLKQPLARSYFLCDFTVLLLSLSYIPLHRILYSLLTVTLSSFIIGRINK